MPRADGYEPRLEPPRPLWHAEVEESERGFADLLEGYAGAAPDAVAHRVVHPGPALATHRFAAFDDRVRAEVEAATPLALGNN